jgi:hypothetical protein
MHSNWASAGWWDDVLSILPDLLGFTLGGYAMWMAIGDDKFRSLISGRDHKKDPEPSSYMQVNAAFVHFIFLQALSILLALLAKALYVPVTSYQVTAPLAALELHRFTPYFWGLSYTVFIYALLSAVAATLALLRTSDWYDRLKTIERERKDDCG